MEWSADAGLSLAAPSPPWEYLTLVKRMGSAGWSAPTSTSASTSPTDPSGGITLAPITPGTELSKTLNRLGVEGWEMVAQVGDELVFKRPSPS